MTEEIQFQDIIIFLERINARIAVLEREHARLEVALEKTDKHKLVHFTQLHAELSKSKQTLYTLSQALKANVKHMILLSSDVKTVVKTEQFETIKEKVDSIPFNEFVTTKDLARE